MTQDKRTPGSRRRSRKQRAARQGQPSAAERCVACGAGTVPQAKFCHHCGAPLDAQSAAARHKPRRAAIVVYVAAGLSILGAVVTSALLIRSERPPSPPVDAGAAARPAPAVDLSTMTPRAAADQLFNRVMSASERGDVQEAARFAPMAVQAYGQVENLDGDARYHLGLLHMLQGNLDGTREQIALMKETVPQHLLALLLEHDAAVQAGDVTAAARAAAAFDAAYETEIAIPRPEYAAHQYSIDQFRTLRVTPQTGAGVPARAAEARSGDAALFASRCAACHGADAAGTDQGPPLVHEIYEPGHHDDASFRRAMRNGVPAHHWQFGDMPPVAGISEQEIERIVAYVRALQRAQGIQ